MKTLKLIPHLRTALTVLLSLGAVAPLSAFVTVDLPGLSEFEGWENLDNAHYTSPTYPDSFGSYTAAWGDDVDANVAGSAGTASLMKLSGGGYFSSQSIYSFDTPGTFSISNSPAMADLETVVFQIELVGGLSAACLLYTSPSPRD